MRERYDAVVIGSGFGGAITACRLAEAGRSVAVLERGGRWDKGDFPRTTGQAAQAFWQPPRAHGFLEYRAFRRMDVIQGVGVGGGSLHYFNVHIRTPQEIFRDARWPNSITRAALDPYYDLVQGMMDSVPLEPPEGRTLPPRTQLFLDAATRAGRSPALLDIAVHTGPDRTSRHGGNLQSACTYCGNCGLGCHVHAKNTLDFTYLGRAERELGAEVFPLHSAERIEPLGEGGPYRVGFRRSGGDGDAGEGSVVGDQVVVAGGTLGSNELLLRCRDIHRTLPELSPALGAGFSGNGDFLLAGALDTGRPADPGQGPSITAQADCSTGEHRITIEDLGFPDPLLWLIEGMLPPRGGRLRRLLRLGVTYTLQSMGLRRERSRVSTEIDALLAGGRTPHFLPYLGMGTDASDGVLRLRNGSIDVEWSHKRSRDMFREMERAMDGISRAAGGRFVTSLLWRWPLRKLLTAHPLGGCAIGDDPATSVANHCGEVWGYPGLYVTDGASIPTALAVNPSLTIGALAERAAFWILHRREMSADDPARPTTG